MRIRSRVCLELRRCMICAGSLGAQAILPAPFPATRARLKGRRSNSATARATVGDKDALARSSHCSREWEGPPESSRESGDQAVALK